ncbi:carotenoid biosynthesis protein, partial [Meiothermus sp. PNK-Is4]
MSWLLLALLVALPPWFLRCWAGVGLAAPGPSRLRWLGGGVWLGLALVG